MFRTSNCSSSGGVPYGQLFATICIIRIVSATRIILRCKVEYCKLPVSELLLMMKNYLFETCRG